MPPITPDKPVGHQTLTRIVVVCPTCGQKRWANICFKDKKGKTARTTCCADLIDIKDVRNDG